MKNPEQRNWSKATAPLCLLIGLLAPTVFGVVQAQIPLTANQNRGELTMKLPFKERLPALEAALKDAKRSRATARQAQMAYECGIYAEKFGLTAKAIQYAGLAIGLSKKTGNRKLEALSLDVQAAVNSDLGKNKVALSILEAAIKIQKEIGDKNGEAVSLDEQGAILTMTGQGKQASELLHQALAVRTEAGDRSGEAETLDHIGTLEFSLGKVDDAKRDFNRALPIWQEIQDPVGEGHTLDNRGALETATGDPKAAEASFQRAYAIQKSNGDRKGEASTENALGELCYASGKLNDAIPHFTKAIEIRRSLKDELRAFESLQNLGVIYSSQGSNAQALAIFNQALPIIVKTDNKSNLCSVLTNIGYAYAQLDDHSNALQAFDQAMPILRSIGDRRGEGIALNGIGMVYDAEGEKEKAISYYLLALPLNREVGNKNGEAISLGSAGGAYRDLGQFGKALEFQQQALKIQIETGNVDDQAISMANIGIVYTTFGQKASALANYGQALEIYRAQNDRSGIANTLNNIGLIQYDQGRMSEALATFLEARSLANQLRMHRLAATILSNIALIHFSQNQAPTAQRELAEVISVARRLKDRSCEQIATQNMGKIYRDQGDFKNALDLLGSSLLIARRSGDLSAEASALSELGLLFSKQNNPQLAIFNLKLAVNAYQALRESMTKLSPLDQESFKREGEETYRRLADILVSQGRLSEAQSVLDLLKDAEFFRYLRTSPSTWLYLTRLEHLKKRSYDEFVESYAADATEYDRLNAISPRTTFEEQEMHAVFARLGTANRRFSDFILIVEKDLSASDQTRIATLKDTSDLSMALKQMPEKSAAVYTLVTNDGVRTILGLPSVTELSNGPRKPIQRQELLTRISLLRSALSDPYYDPIPLCSEFYELLIRPIESELMTAGVHHLMFSLDGPLRYIPVAALYDKISGKFLFEKYSCSLFTAGHLESLNHPLAHNPKGAGFGVSTTVQDGPRTIPGLASVPIELAAFQKAFGATVYTDKDFTRDSFIDAMLRHPNMIHIATHCELNPGDASNSYMYIGNNKRLSMDDLNGSFPQGSMSNVDLLVLSACDTATPAGDESDGGEYESFAVVTKRFGAHAVLASLWPVNDMTTAALMSKFYSLIKDNPGMGKLECLHKAQAWLKESSGDLAEVKRTGNPDESVVRNRLKQLERFNVDTNHPFRHPFYWAPFVLTGNID